MFIPDEKCWSTTFLWKLFRYNLECWFMTLSTSANVNSFFSFFPLQEFKGVSFQPLLFLQFLLFGYLFLLGFVTVNLF